MDRRVIDYSLDGYCRNIKVEIMISDDVNIPESAVNKALMIAINYLIENMETEEVESAE